ncbi:MAG: PAS domain S-box protein [Bacteroidia bacterium]|nr:PAS domain S-box protein [Bacteroidia bacterium]
MNSAIGLEVLFEFANEGILIANKLGDIIKINPSAERLFGYKKGELVGKKIETLIPKRLADAHLKHRTTYNHNPHARAMGAGIELYGKRKDNTELPVEVSLSPYVNNNEHFVIAFIIDISERKKNQERIKNHSIELEKQVHDRTLILEEAVTELEQTKNELKKALDKERELNDMKSRFVSMASHEFRTPLATILSSLSLVSKYIEKNDNEKRIKHIARIKSAVNNMTDILNDFLSLSKLEEGKITNSPEQFDLKRFTEELVQEMTAIVKPDQVIDYIHLSESTGVTLDKKLIKNIFFNLISNAIKFSDEGQVIDVETNIDKKSIRILVRDKGIGISEADKEHLFERFFRAKNAFNIQGTGLGLNIISKYVELMNGEIGVESKLNEGTTFTITLPKN